MFAKIAFFLSLACLVGGCSSYKLCSMLPPQIETVHMSTVVNETNEPLIENDVTTAILSELQRDGSLAIAPSDTADALMYVRVYGYKLTPLSYTRDSRSLPDEYRLTLTAEVELVERETGKSLVRTGQVRFPTGGLSGWK